MYPSQYTMSIYSGYPPTKRTLIFLLSATLLWSSCGGKKSTASTGVSITISPTNVSMAAGTTQQFTATVTGSTNTAVTWQVNGEANGDAIIGTIDANGLYKAPLTVPPNNPVITITAIAQADTTKTAPATVTLTAPAVTISLAPTSATLAAGAQQQFTPTISVTGSSNNAVTWLVNNVAGGDAIHGTIDGNGLYTAPLAPPKTGITVTAQSQANTAFSASSPVTVQFGKASVQANQTYVFFVSRPDDSSGAGFAYRAGSFTSDGNGTITSGTSDASSGTAGAFTSGSYSIETDGRGTLNFNDAAGAHTFSFALTSSTRGQVISFDSGPVMAGFIREQDAAAASAAPSGNYVFSLSGDSAGPAAAVGQLVFGSTITGTEDLNTNGVVAQPMALTGSGLSLGSGGRGTVQINGSNYAFYIIDASTLVLADVDASGSKLAGTAYAQSGTFSNASLGTSAYLVSGVTSGSGPKAYAQAGRFDTNSAGNIVTGTFDTNTAGGAATNSQFGSSLKYNVGSNGRLTFSNGTSNFIVWLASSKQGVILQSDSTNVASGLILQQQIGVPSVTAGFAAAALGTDASGASAQAMDVQLTIAGFGLSSGTQDANPPKATNSFQNGTVTISNPSTERGSVTIPGATFTVYFVTADRFFLMSSGNGAPVLSGAAERQCSDCTF